MVLLHWWGGSRRPLVDFLHRVNAAEFGDHPAARDAAPLGMQRCERSTEGE